MQAAHQRADFLSTRFGQNVDDVVYFGLGRGRRAGGDVFGGKRAVVAAFIERDFLQRLAEITGVDGIGQIGQIAQGVLTDILQTRAVQFGLDLGPCGRVVIDRGGIGTFVGFKEFAQLGGGL